MNLFSSWKDKVSNYIDVRLGLFKLGLIQRTSTVLGHMLVSIIYIFLGLGGLIFFGFGVMELFSSLCDSRIGGAFITAGLFGVMLFILVLMRKQLAAAFAGVFIRVLTEGDDDDEDDDDTKPGKSKTEANNPTRL